MSTKTKTIRHGWQHYFPGLVCPECNSKNLKNDRYQMEGSKNEQAEFEIIDDESLKRSINIRFYCVDCECVFESKSEDYFEKVEEEHS